MKSLQEMAGGELLSWMIAGDPKHKDERQHQVDEEFKRRVAAAAATAKNGNGKLSCRANPTNGSISLYGVRRMPVTYFRSEWQRILGEGAKEVLSFIEKHGQYLPTGRGETATLVPAELIGDGKPFRIPAEKAAE